MTHTLPFILASGDGEIVKLIFWAVIIFIFVMVRIVKFIAGSITSAPTARTATPAPRPVRIPQRLPPMAAGAVPLPPLPMKGAKAKRKVARKVTAAAIPAGPLPGLVSALQQPREAPSAPPLVSPSRSRGAGWLDARTIRAQFIMSEAMKKPISLR